jgi:glycosyltransferase involved in cell wall biosynthesis
MSAPTRILMLAPACYPVQGAESFVNAKLVLAGLEAGWDIEVVSQDRGGYPADPDPLWAPLAGRVIASLPLRRGWSWRRLVGEAVGAVRTGHLLPGGDWAAGAVASVRGRIDRRGYDLMLSRLPGGHLAALTLARLDGIPWIAQFNDPWPDGAYPPPYPTHSDAGLSYFQRRFLSALAERVAWVTFPCPRLRRYMLDYLPSGLAERSSVIPHIALPRLGRQSEPAGEGPFTLVHAGALTPPRDPNIFLEGLRLFLDRTKAPDARVLLIGPVGGEIPAAIKRLRLDEVVSCQPPMPYAASLEALARSHVAVIIEARCPEGIFLPSKFVDCVQLGRPVLAVCPPVGTLADILTTQGGGLAADASSAEAVAESLNVLYTHWRAGTLQEAFGSGRLMDSFGPQAVIGAYKRLFERLPPGRRD